MPVIAMFYGIIIRMYFLDTQQHSQPRIHAEYSGDSAVFAIDDGSVLAGAVPRKQARLVQAWIELHRDELKADWNLAVNGEALFKIEPLR